MTAGMIPAAGPNQDGRLIAMQPGIAPNAGPPLQLQGGAGRINAVQVYNASSTYVQLYKGMTAPQGTPISVPPWQMMTILVNGLQFIYVAIKGLPIGTTEFCDLLWTDQTLTAVSSPAGSPPQPASVTPWTFSENVQYNGTPGQGIKLLNETISFNTGIFLTSLKIDGAAAQKISWAIGAAFGFSVLPNFLFGMGDADFEPSQPFPISQEAIVAQATVIKLVLNPYANANGVPTPLNITAGGYFV